MARIKREIEHSAKARPTSEYIDLLESVEDEALSRLAAAREEVGE